MKKIDALFIGSALLMVLFLNTFFNFTSGTAINEEGSELEDKFYLAGPDPYYNMRLIEKTVETGKYPYMGGKYGGLDPLLNYPLGGSGGRPPLFNMLAIGLGKFMSIFMDGTDALGYAMQFLPAFYGALLVIPVYFIAKMLFNRKVGIIASWLIPLIPIHLASGHGSSYSLFDHDSFILLLTSLTLMFLMMSLREKNEKKSMIFAGFAGISISAITMTWVSSQYIYAVVAVFAVVQMIVDIFTKKINIRILRNVLIALFTGYIISSPILFIKQGFSFPIQLAIPVAVLIFGLIYLYIGKKNIPWLISLPALFGVGGIFLVFLYLVRNSTNALMKPFVNIANIIYGTGIYGKKVSLTIAEASTFDFSRTVMSFGPAIYLLGWLGFLFLLHKYYKKGFKKEYMVMLTWFGVETWLVSVAGRFLNDLVPIMAILSASIIWLAISKIDFSSMIKTLKGVGGGWYGIKKAIRTRHVAGAIIIALFVVFPNGWLAFDASIPSDMKGKFNTNKLGAFGLSVNTEEYWQDAFKWLREENGGINDTEKPAFISWWDYGFYCVAVANNPTVADNFQEGIPTAANFHTSLDELEAITVLITRLAEGDMNKNGGKLSEGVRQTVVKYMGNKSADLIKIWEEPTEYANTTYNKIIGEKYGGERYRVREDHARYHDATSLILELNDDDIISFYREMQNRTGYSIRYYGVEGYDINIFNVFTFLADKGVYGYETTEDDYYKLWYKSEKTGQKFTPDEIKNITKDMTQDEIRDLYGKFDPYVERKDTFYKSMVYRVYLGNVPRQLFDNLSRSGLIPFWTDNPTNPIGGEGNYYYNPTAYLKHFVIEYLSPLNLNRTLYFARASLCIGMPAVVIAKFYEGAQINGTVESDGKPLDNIRVVVRDDFKQKIEMRYGNQILNRTIEKIPHDVQLTDENGKFSVIVPAGNITLSFYSGEVLLKEITFNGTGKFSPISEEEATRISSWKRDIGVVNIEKGGIRGMVYWDKDGDGKYNASVDKRIKAQVKIGDETVSTDSNGNYRMDKLLPKTYAVSAIKEGYDSKRVNVDVEPNRTVWHNISLTPSKVNVKGRVWYDENKNGKLDENETLSDVDIEFNLIEALDENARSSRAVSDENGNYSINLSPSKYEIVVNYTKKIDNETTIHYTYRDTLNIKIGDTEKIKDIKVAKD
ncbi:MAG TPA: hypothetical protein ENI33_05150 [Thermoplasmatales archaeon]|nr:hypothetical protein [Thermoplasmatales archaeon]